MIRKLKNLDLDGSKTDQKKEISRTFWRYAIPSMAAMFVNGLYQIIDGMFVGHYIGYEGLASVVLAHPILGIVAGFGIMIGMGSGALLSIARGEANISKAKSILSNGFWLIAIFSLLSMLMIILFAPSLLMAQGASGNSLALSIEYIEIFSWGAIFTIAAAALPMLIRNDDSPNFSTWLMIAGAFLNIVLDQILIGELGLGLKGAAIGTVISQCFVSIIGIGYFLSSLCTIKLDLKKIAFNFPIALKSVQLGGSSLFMFLYYSFILAVHNKLFMIHGSSVHVGAFAIVGYLGAIYYNLAEGIAGGMQPPISYYFGANQLEKIKATVLLALKIILYSGAALLLLLHCFPELFIGLFSKNDPSLLAETQNGLFLHLFTLPLDGFIFLTSVYFMAVGQGKKALAISIGNMLIQLPFLLVLPNLLGIDGIWLSVPLSNLTFSLIIAPLLWKDLKIKSEIYLHSNEITDFTEIKDLESKI